MLSALEHAVTQIDTQARAVRTQYNCRRVVANCLLKLRRALSVQRPAQDEIHPHALWILLPLAFQESNSTFFRIHPAQFLGQLSNDLSRLLLDFHIVGKVFQGHLPLSSVDEIVCLPQTSSPGIRVGRVDHGSQPGCSRVPLKFVNSCRRFTQRLDLQPHMGPGDATQHRHNVCQGHRATVHERTPSRLCHT